MYGHFSTADNQFQMEDKNPHYFLKVCTTSMLFKIKETNTVLQYAFFSNSLTEPIVLSTLCQVFLSRGYAQNENID